MGCKKVRDHLVALRKESVDRNLMTAGDVTAPSAVALRKESVDRNGCNSLFAGGLFGSLSARRAWIEIGPCWPWLLPLWVALRKESVDRNQLCRLATYGP